MKFLNFYFEKETSTIHFESLLNTQVKIKIVISDAYLDCPLYTFDTVTGYNGWIVPCTDKIKSLLLQGLKYPGFNIRVYDDHLKLIQFESVELYGIDESKIIDYHTDPFDALGASYLDFFYGDLCQGMDTTGVVVDAGANVGFFTLYSKMGGARRIYTVEPDASPYYYLEKNFKKFPNIVLINKALSHNKESIQFVISKIDSVSNSEYLAKVRSEDIIYHTMVECIDIPTILDIEGSINLLKLDIEGTEFRVLANLSTNHFRRINQFFIEFHDDPKPLMNTLQEQGYLAEYRHSTENDLCGFIYAKRI